MEVQTETTTQIHSHFMHLLTHLLTYLLTYSMKQSPSWEANRFSASQEIPRILWNPKVWITALTSARHLSLTWASSIQSIPPLRSILLFSSHLRLGLPSGLFPSGFPTKMVFLFCTPLHALHTELCIKTGTQWSMRWVKPSTLLTFLKLFYEIRPLCFSFSLYLKDFSL